MQNDFNSLLPPNAQKSERALERAGAEQINAIPKLTSFVKNPDLCPVALLPWLAWEFSVDTWNTEWSERDKRDAIKRAAYIHRHRGTRGAIEMSLSALPFSSEVVEWFEQEPAGEPYSFLLNVEQDDRPITQGDIQDLKNAVLRAKNLRSWFGVSFRGTAGGGANLAGYISSVEHVTLGPEPESVLSEENK